MIRWVKRLQGEVTSRAHSRGANYFAAGRVTLQHGDPERVEALVEGSQTYSVSVLAGLSKKTLELLLS